MGTAGNTKFDYRHNEPLVVDDGEHLVLVEDGLADGVPGGNADDIVPSSLDAAGGLMNNTKYIEHVNRITQLEKDCQNSEAIWRQLKADCKSAFTDFDAAQSRLRAYIRGLSTPMPLFEDDQNDSPAGEDGELDGAIVGADRDQAGGARPEDYISESEDGPRSDEAQGKDVKDSVCPAGPAGRPDDEECEERICGGGGPVDAARDCANDKKWEDADLGGVLSPGIVKNLQAEGLRTMGQLMKFVDSGKQLSLLKGIGPAKEAEIKNRLSLKCFRLG